MTAAEQSEFLSAGLILNCATNGADGWPHLMPLWYVMRYGEPWAWTFAKSQKARNLERDPRATAQVEAGDSYEELRGVMIEANVEVIAETPVVFELAMEIFTKYGNGKRPGPEVAAMLRAQAPKRIAMRYRPVKTVTWDHRKLGGVY